MRRRDSHYSWSFNADQSTHWQTEGEAINSQRSVTCQMLMKKELANGKKPKQGRKIQWASQTRERGPLFSHDFADFSAVVCVVCFRNLGQAEPDTAVWISFYLLCHFNIVLLLSLSLLQSTVGPHPSLSSFIAVCFFLAFLILSSFWFLYHILDVPDSVKSDLLLTGLTFFLSLFIRQTLLVLG